ncbi:MAG: dihydrofolate reductase [Gaiella sp.]
MPELVVIAAVAANGVIGRDGQLPWHLPEDLAHFRDATWGSPVVMGRRTWESLPERFRPLPGRRNIVVTRNEAWKAPGAERAGSLRQALDLLEGAPRVCVIGGVSLFAETIPLADELQLTELADQFAGDVYFPTWPRGDFVETARDAHESADGSRFAFVTYRRRA